MEVRDAKTKRMALDQRRQSVAEIEAQVARLEKAMQADEAPRGCFAALRGFVFGRRAAATAAVAPRREMSAVERAVFGKSKPSVAATDKLAEAASSMAKHVAALEERAAAARSQAKTLMAAGRKAEAMMALKRAKQTEKQVENALATHAALERQVDVLAESELQKQVASALSASVATAKKRTKGLMTKAEDAVDGAVELRDFAEDVASAFGGLQQDAFDDDELLAELQSMSAEGPAEAEVAVAAPVVAPVAAPVVAAAEVVAEFPAAPTRRAETKKLLADDSAAAALCE